MSDYLRSLRDRGVYRHMFSRRIRNRLDARTTSWQLMMSSTSIR